MADYDAIVIGLGAMGSAAAYQLARRGQRVLGLDAFAAGHTFGSSHGETRIIRMAYFEHPDYVPLLRRAWQLWEELQSDSATALLFQTGGLFIGPPHGDLVAGSLRSARQHGLPHSLLEADEIRRRFPVFNVRDGEQGLFEERAGVLRAEHCIEAQLELAAAASATLRHSEPVRAWAAEASGEIWVETERGRFTAGTLVVTAGAWAGGLLGTLRLPLQPERMPLFWLAPLRGPERFERDRLPVWIYQDPGFGEFFGTPHLDWPGVKVGKHHTGEFVDAETVDRVVHARDEAPMRGFLGRCMPDLVGQVMLSTVCLYTNTPDGHFVVDRHPDWPNVVFAAGFSGHGFKFAPVIGEILADLATKGRATADADFLRLTPGRFDSAAASLSAEP